MTSRATLLLVIVAMAFAVVALTIMATSQGGEKGVTSSSNENSKEILTRDMPGSDEKLPAVSTKRVSRFLQQGSVNPRPGFQCNRDNDVCREEGSPGSTCCNNRCIDLMTDNKNCGACRNKCKYTESCCNGQCVNLAFDKRHCGKCQNKCMQGGFCIYAMCDYA